MNQYEFKPYTFLDYLKETLFRNIKLVLITAPFIIGVILLQTMNVQGSSKPQYKYYTSVEVSSGDTVWSIAQRYMDDSYTDIHEYIAEIEDINGISGSDITAGNYIIVPYYSDEIQK